MQRVKILALRSQRRAKKDERGVALITTLLLLMLLTGLTLTMAWSARSDMLINGYYRNFRGAFYAADSGLNVVRQAAINQFTPGVGLRVEMIAQTVPNALTIPESAVLTSPSGNASVIVVDSENKPHKKGVTLGVHDAGNVQVAPLISDRGRRARQVRAARGFRPGPTREERVSDPDVP